ncbi:hypothetical protein WG66_007529 [Moniliophthora roreri]|nr:hypothetical protein WG66_007529 [Moniliophthora roreri]
MVSVGIRWILRVSYSIGCRRIPSAGFSLENHC